MAWNPRANITQELMARLQAEYERGQLGGSGYNNASYIDPTTGAAYAPNINRVQNSGAEGDFTDRGVNGITATDGQQWYEGQRGYVYDPQGGFTGDFAVEDPNKRDWGELIAKGMIGAIAGGAALSGLAGGAGGALPGGAGMDVAGFEGLADAGLGGANGVGTLAGDAFLPGQLGVNGANLSAAIPGTSFMNSSGLNTLLSGAGLTGGGAAAGTAGAAGTAAKWLGPAATLLGAAAGAKGQKTEQTSERKTDPRVDPYLFGANGQPGLLQMTYDKLAGQMAPGGLQGYDDMQRVGRGLLNTPVAGNGFGLFGRIR